MNKPKTKYLIHLVGGEKGGAGKTLFSRTLIQYCLDEKLRFQAVEADFSNPDVATVYTGVCEKARFSADERDTRGVDRIFEWALEKLVIVNLPAQSHDFVKSWIDNNYLIDLGEQNSIGFVHWFVCSGGYDSVQLFLKSIQDYDKRVLHVLVKNMGLRDDWSDVDSDKDFKRITTKHKPYSTIEFPKLAYFERDVIDRERLRFDVASQCKEYGFGIVNRQRVHNFLRDAYAEIKQTKLFDDELRNEKVEVSRKYKNTKVAAADNGNEKLGSKAVITSLDSDNNNGNNSNSAIFSLLTDNDSDKNQVEVIQAADSEDLQIDLVDPVQERQQGDDSDNLQTEEPF